MIDANVRREKLEKEKWKRMCLILPLMAAILGISAGYMISGQAKIVIEYVDRKVEIREITKIAFTMSDDCIAATKEIIYYANKSIYVAMPTFTSGDIADMLIEKHREGVDVRVLFEKDMIDNSTSEYWRLRSRGVPVRNDTSAGFMNERMMLVDGNITVTGSFYWSWNAQNRNNENMIVISDSNVTDIFTAEFLKLWEAGV